MAGSNFQYATPYNVGAPGSNVQANGGGMTQLIGFRDILDARRAMLGQRIPSSQYPDGYLGTIVSRRNDRLLQNVQGRLTQRNYQRGVHKGERIDPVDYYWTERVNPMAALQAQARGEKWTQEGSYIERLAHMGKTAGMRTPEEMAAVYAQYGVKDTNVQPIDPVRAEKLQRLMPGWR